VVFAYGFDLKSTAIRKNPMGALEAFQLAFPLPNLPASFGHEINDHPLSNQVALMIKAFPPQGESAEWHWLQLRAAEDPRIHLIAANLERDELLYLYGCCDAFLSLHRSEGFGRGMAEALQLGLDVIATDYGGNTDFCTGPLSHHVRYREVPIPRGAYPCADGHRWAEPDLEHAAELMSLGLIEGDIEGPVGPLPPIGPLLVEVGAEPEGPEVKRLVPWRLFRTTPSAEAAAPATQSRPVQVGGASSSGLERGGPGSEQAIPAQSRLSRLEVDQTCPSLAKRPPQAFLSPICSDSFVLPDTAWLLDPSRRMGTFATSCARK
jgi:hypothetical protein